MEDFTKGQKDALDQMAEGEAKENVKKQFRKANEKARGEFFHPFTKFLQPKEESFDGGYQEFCKRMNNKTWEQIRPSGYRDCVNKVTMFAEGKIDDISVASYRSKVSVSDESSTVRDDSTTEGKERNRLHGKSKNVTAKKLHAQTKTSIFGGEGNQAHLLEKKSTECAHLQGIIGPAILGVDLASICSDRDRLIRAFRATAIGDSSGLCDSMHNIIKLPKAGHEMYFDSPQWPAWLVLPVKDLVEAADFDPQKGYWVIPLAGLLQNLESNGVNAQNLSHHKKECLKTLYGEDYEAHPDTQRLAKPEETKKAIAFLVACIKALADVVTGLPIGESVLKKLMPIELDRTEGKKRLSPEKKEMMEKTCASLLDGKVWIPDFIESVDLKSMNILMVRLEPGVVPLPDPLLLGVKSAINWMAQNGQKPLPTCPDPDSSDDEDDEEARYDDDTPSTPARVPEAVFFPTTPTPSPARDRPAEKDSGLESDLDSESDFQDAW